MASSPGDHSRALSFGYESHTRAVSHAQASAPTINRSPAVSAGALVAYQPPPAVARAHADRGYCALQLEARAAALERKARMTPPPQPYQPPPPEPPPPRWPTAKQRRLAERQALRAAVAREEADARAEVKHVLESHLRATATLRVVTIQSACADEFDVSLIDILSHRRTKRVITPRHVALFLCCELTKRSLPEIGRKFGDRDHTTVLHASRKIAARVQLDAELKRRVDSVRARLDQLMAPSPARPDDGAGSARHAHEAPCPVGLSSAGEHTPMPRSGLAPDDRLEASGGGATVSVPTAPVYQPSESQASAAKPLRVRHGNFSHHKWRFKQGAWTPPSEGGEG